MVKLFLHAKLMQSVSRPWPSGNADKERQERHERTAKSYFYLQPHVCWVHPRSSRSEPWNLREKCHRGDEPALRRSSHCFLQMSPAGKPSSEKSASTSQTTSRFRLANDARASTRMLNPHIPGVPDTKSTNVYGSTRARPNGRYICK